MDFLNYWQALPKSAILVGTVKVPANKMRDEINSSLYYCGGDKFVVVIEGDNNRRLQGLANTSPKDFLDFYKSL